MSAPGEPARTPAPPYYAVIFTSRRTEGDRGYGAMAEKMAALAAQQPGYLGMERRARRRRARPYDFLLARRGVDSSRGTRHRAPAAQRGGQQTWYADYEVRIAKWSGPYGKPTIDRGIYCHCESSRPGGTTKQSSHFDELKVPSWSRD